MTNNLVTGVPSAADNSVMTQSVELRTDILTGRQVLIAEDRANRPNQAQHHNLETDAEHDPFLLGNEDQTPGERLALRHKDSSPDGPGWLLRVIPNRYPAVSEHASQIRTASPLLAVQSATGVHDVVVECPDGRQRLADLTRVEVARILSAWQHRARTLLQRDRIRAVSIFRNEGFEAGASIAHSHSQIIASDFVPTQMQQRLNVAQAVSHNTGQSVYLEWLQSELRDGRRILCDDADAGTATQNSTDTGSTANFVVLLPFAGRVSWHTRFAPAAQSETDFCLLSEADLWQLAGHIRSVTDALEQVAGPVAHNLTLHLPPNESSTDLPWMLDLLPRTGGIAGFELMADTDIITLSPETAAERLRKHLSPPAAKDTFAQDLICPAGYVWMES